MTSVYKNYYVLE